jgi:cysteine-rich repeat protein
MRTSIATFAALIPLFAATPAAAADEGARLLRCQQRISSAAGHFLAQRRQALTACVERALRCPAALTSTATAADDACLATAADRCRARLVVVHRAQLRLDMAGPRCTHSVSLGGFFGADGLSFEEEGAYCPEMAIGPDVPTDTSRCQRYALACTADAEVALAAPRAGEFIKRLGVSVEDNCLVGALCGNGEIDDGEECDDGPDNSDLLADHCRHDCTLPRCGDGVVDPGEGEECDDGNLVDGDGCDSDCTVTSGACGNGVIDPGEECDDGPLNSDLLPDHCRTDCTAPSCGDGVVDSGEECEPPGTAVCDDSCLLRGAGALATDTTGTPDDVMRCEQALMSGGATLFDHYRKRLERCVDGVAHCLLGISPDRDPDGDRTDACLERATGPCTALVAARDAFRARIVANVVAPCQALPATELLDPSTGLGFTGIAAACAGTDGAAVGVSDLLDCAFRNIACSAENAVSRSIPRAYDFIDETDLSPDDAFPCLTDPTALGSPSGAFID